MPRGAWLEPDCLGQHFARLGALDSAGSTNQTQRVGEGVTCQLASQFEGEAAVVPQNQECVGVGGDIAVHEESADCSERWLGACPADDLRAEWGLELACLAKLQPNDAGDRHWRDGATSAEVVLGYADAVYPCALVAEQAAGPLGRLPALSIGSRQSDDAVPVLERRRAGVCHHTAGRDAVFAGDVLDQVVKVDVSSAARHPFPNE